MLRRADVAPFLSERDGELQVSFLEDPDGRVTRFLERLLRLTKRLEGRSRGVVREALRRQERRVRDVRRLTGLSRTLLSLCRFEPPSGADQAPEVRRALFRARGTMWPPVPGDGGLPYAAAGEALGIAADEVERLLYADDPEALVLAGAPRVSARELLRRYNLDLARAVLLDAEELEVRARGGWRDIFRAVKLARLMHRLEPAGRRSFRLTLTGPAAPFLVRARRYGHRFARIVPALVRAPGWSLEARVAREEGRTVPYRLTRARTIAPRRARRAGFDSRWERDLAHDFEEKVGTERNGWRLYREDMPISLGDSVFLPDFTLRHADGRTALVELVGFWTPEYLEEKLRKVEAAGLRHLVLVVFRGLAAHRMAEGGTGDRATGDQRTAAEAMGALPGAVVWFGSRVRIGPVMEAVERVAVKGAGT